MTTHDLALAIALVDKADKDDLRKLQDVMKRRWSAIDSMAVAQFQIGSRVQFSARGQQVTAVVEKINQRSVTVRLEANGMRWKVSGSLLTAL